MNKKIYDFCFETLPFILLNVLFFDLALTGDGRFLMIGSLSFRIILLIIIIICSIPKIVINLKKIITNKFIIILMIFSGLLVFSTIIGIKQGNDINILKTDIKGFVYFILFPIFLVNIDSKDKLTRILKTILMSTIVQSLFILVTYLIYYISPNAYFAIYEFTSYMNGFNFYAPSIISTTLIRQFTFSSIYLILGLFLSIYFYFFGNEKNYKCLYPISFALIIYAIFVTYTRSLYIGALASIGIFLIVFFKYLSNNYKKTLYFSSTVILSSLIIFTSLSLIGSIDHFMYGIIRTFPSLSSVISVEDKFPIGHPNGNKSGDKNTNDSGSVIQDVKDDGSNQLDEDSISDDLRSKTVQIMIDSIKESPIIGHGLGKAVPNRVDGRTEYFFLDILNKMGIIGLLSYCYPIFYALYFSIRMRIYRYTSMIVFNGLLGFMITSWFNPYMGAALGISCYCLFMACFSLEYSEE
ncbi:MAG: O-antigen ligase family protein [Erysipelotrichaceae bacterium]